jgi:hypothetical protein
MTASDRIRLWKARLAHLRWLFHNYTCNAERAKAFVRMGLGSVRTFYHSVWMFKLASEEACVSAIAALEAVEAKLGP